MTAFRSTACRCAGHAGPVGPHALAPQHLALRCRFEIFSFVDFGERAGRASSVIRRLVLRLGFRWWRFVAALGLLCLAVSVWVALPPGRVDAQTAGSYHAAPFLFDTSDYLMVDNVGSLSAGSYHGPPYQFDTSDYLMVDCAAGCTGTGTANTFTATQTFQGSPQINISNGSTSQSIGYDGVNITIGKLKITNSLNMGANTLSGVGKITQQAANDMWGSCAMAAGTSCTITWSYAPTYCSKPNPVGTTVISGVANISSTTITVTAASSNSLTWDVTCQ